jgi:hypothetical protein
LTHKSILKILIGSLCFFLSSLEGTAQSAGSEFGFGLGASIYQGDLSPHWIGAYNRPGLSFQITAQKNLFPLLAIRGLYAYASIRDNEANYASGVHRLRKLSFETSINEFSAQLVLNPSRNNGEEEPGNFRPYFFGGIGVAFVSIKRDFSRFDRNYPHWQTWVLPGLAADSMATMPSSVVTVPVGAGLRFQISDNIAMYTEVSKRIARTEYLDGFSKSANTRENDGFSSAIVGLVFRLGGGNGGRGSTECPVNVW